MNLSEFCLRRPVLATVASILIVFLGIAGLTRMPVRELPDVDTAEVTVSVTYVGAGPGVVDAELTTLIEGAIAGVPGIDTISSEAELGGSRTVITFDTGRDIDQAAADVRAAVDAVAPDLPEAAEEPRVEKNDTEGDPVIRLTMTSETLTAAQLTDYADRYVVDRLETIQGVASVDLSGERAYAMRIWLDADAMAGRGVTVDDITAALRENNTELPSGEVETASRTFVLRTETRLADASEFEELIIGNADGYLVRLGDVAEVDLGVEDDDSYFRANGLTAVGLNILRQSRSNTVGISAAVGEALDDIRGDMPDGTRIEVATDDATYIRDSIRGVLVTLAIAVCIVVAVIFVFLASVRVTLIPAVTIPIALLGACAGIAAAGFSLNILTLFALILAIGLVVDDAIVVLENIERRVENGDDPGEAAAKGARQVQFAVISTSATLIAVFVPLSFLRGEVGRLFSEFGVTLAIAVAVSTFVALSLCPIMAAKVLRPGDRTGRLARSVNAATDRLASGYRRALGLAIRTPVITLGIAALLSGASWSLYTGLPSALTPDEDRKVFFVSIESPAGASLDYTDAAVRQVEAALQPWVESGAITDIISIVGQYGEPQRAFVVPVMAPWGERDIRPRELIDELRPIFAAMTLADIRSFAPSGLGGGGGSGGLDVVVNAPSFDLAAAWSAELVEILRDEPLLANLRRDHEVNTPGYDVTIDRERARALGIDAASIASTIQTLFASREVTEFIDRDRQYPVILQARDRDRSSLADLTGINVRTGDGVLVPLDGLVAVERRASVRAYNRFDRQPSVEISASLAEGADLGGAIEAVEAAAERLPDGLRLDYTGQAAEYRDTTGGIVITFGLALLVVYLVLAAQFESFVQPVVIMLSVPLAITGALLTILMTGSEINVFSQVGMVMLVGLMAKNGILIVEFANQLREEGKAVRDAVIEAASVRLRPILMTVLSTVLGAVPLVLASGAGAESRFSIGIVIIGGFLFASLLTLFLTPVLYDLMQSDPSEEGAPSSRAWTPDTA